MCGRFSFIKKNKKEILSRFRLKEIPQGLVESAQISPGQNVPAVLNESPTRLSLVRWGLIPSWAKEEAIGYKTFNARAETIFEKPAFKEAVRRRHCLILSDGFYEWKKIGKTKECYRITLKKGGLFCFAGIWDVWRNSGREIKSCSVVTTVPNSLIAPIHNRMPVILKEHGEEQWLTHLNPEEIEGFFKPYPAEELAAVKLEKKFAEPLLAEYLFQ